MSIATSTATIASSDINDLLVVVIGMNAIVYDKLIVTLLNLQLIFHISSKVAYVDDNYVDSYNSVYGTSMTSLLERSVLMQLRCNKLIANLANLQLIFYIGNTNCMC